MVRKHWRYIALHTIAAAIFIFVVQFYGLNAPIESAVLWAVVFGGCAAGLAAMQSAR